MRQPTPSPLPVLICLSHLRWSFVYQRPQHLMARYAKVGRVFFVEEPVRDACSSPRMAVVPHGAVLVAVPHIPATFDQDETLDAQRTLLNELIRSHAVSNFILWYYTPAALPYSDHLSPDFVVYDCMDELAAFKGAARDLPALERRLMSRAGLVFTGGQALYEAKRRLHPNVHAVPSSVDVEHFASARQIAADPDDQALIPRPRLGFFGVLDERLDIPLLDGVAETRPDWQLVMIGPVVKIDWADLPRRPNIHYLGAKTYAELPRYIAGWDVATLLFARNAATRYISPTKTPEYLAAGKPVVSTSIADVVRTYGARDLVRIGDSVAEFVAACHDAMTEAPEARRRRADFFLRGMSWDHTWARTATLLASALNGAVRTPAATSDYPLGA
jgi:UDP-galactopyranose mutase